MRSYDAHKRRVKITEGTKVFYPVYSQAGVMLHKFDVSENKPSDYVYLNGMLVAKDDGVPGAPAPIAPSVITAPESNDTGSYTISWTAVSGANQFQAKCLLNISIESKVVMAVTVVYIEFRL